MKYTHKKFHSNTHTDYWRHVETHHSARPNIDSVRESTSCVCACVYRLCESVMAVSGAVCMYYLLLSDMVIEAQWCYEAGWEGNNSISSQLMQKSDPVCRFTEGLCGVCARKPEHYAWFINRLFISLCERNPSKFSLWYEWRRGVGCVCVCVCLCACNSLR